MSNNARPISEISEDINRFLASYHGGQEALANAMGVNQSTISRALKGSARKRLSKGLKKLCDYAGIPLTKPVTASPPDPRTNPNLISALAEVWDGSSAHARALAKIIRDLKLLRQ
jgi:transcriptional regulator with XRE-family HTH domain